MPFRFPPGAEYEIEEAVRVGETHDYILTNLPAAAYGADVQLRIVEGDGEIGSDTSVVAADGAFKFYYTPAAEGAFRLRVTVTAAAIPPTEVKGQAVARAADTPTVESTEDETTDEDDPPAAVNHVHTHTHEHTHRDERAQETTEDDRPPSKFYRYSLITVIAIVALGALSLAGIFLTGRAQHKRLASTPAGTEAPVVGTAERPMHISGTIELTGLPEPADFSPIMINGDCNGIPEAAFTSGRPVLVNGNCNKVTDGATTASSSP